MYPESRDEIDESQEDFDDVYTPFHHESTKMMIRESPKRHINHENYTSEPAKADKTIGGICLKEQ